MSKIIFQDWGRTAYKTAWNKQEALLLENKELKFYLHKQTNNYFIFCEHPHVYTIGKSGDESNLLIQSELLKKIDATIFKTNRGGDITYHGPGQIVGYPIIDLDFFNIGVKQYILQLEEIIILTLADYGLKGERLSGATGVWLDTNTINVRKICAIGVRVSRGITMHGFAFNINTDLTYFSHINPCGFTDKGVTSLSKELGKEINIEEVKDKIKKFFVRVFI